MAKLRRGWSGGIPEWKIALSGWMLRLEAWTARFWAAFVWLAAAIALALWDVPSLLPGWLHLAALILAIGGFFYLLFLGVRQTRRFGRAEALRRLESVNALDHRPLSTLEDSPAGGSAMDRQLWEIHRARVLKRLQGIGIGTPAPVLPLRDRFALRHLALVALVGGGFAAGPEIADRLSSAISPKLFAATPREAARLDAWITPPAYTGQAPVFLTQQAGMGVDLKPDLAQRSDLVSVPEGSVLTAQISGGEGNALAKGLGPDAGFEAFGDNALRLETKLGQDVTLSLSRGEDNLGDWRIAVIPDQPPEIELAKDPKATPQFALELAYAAKDDYGLAEVGARIRRADPPEGSDPDAGIDLPLVLRGANPKQSKMTGFHDLSAHPWAGLEVELTLFARDAAGQEGTSQPHRFTLPERPFNHPVARAIIAERKRLAADPEGAARDVADALRAIGRNGDAYDNDTTIYLALSLAARRIGAAIGGQALDPIYKLLWDTALKLEDGGLSLAQARLREAQRELMEAIAKDAPREELERLMAEVEQAMRELMQAMQEQMQRQLQAMQERGEQPPEFDPNTMQLLDMQDLQSMMDRIREMMEAGLMDQAQQLLSELQQMMENMQAGKMAQMSNQAMEGMQAMDTLQQTIKAQQELMDRAFEEAQRQMGMTEPQVSPGNPQSIRDLLEQLMRERQGQGPGEQGRSQQGQQGQQGEQQAGRQPGDGPDGAMPGQGGSQGQNGQPRPGQGQSAGNKAEQILQEALRRRLGDIMQRFGEITGEVPREFGRAERAMREAGEALARGAPGDSVDPQGRAIEELQNAARQAAQQMMQQMGQSFGPVRMQERLGGTDPQRQDPFGRDPGQAQRGLNQSDVDIPQERDLQRSREIRDELRRRSGERQRPGYELDYIDRLLEQFQ